MFFSSRFFQEATSEDLQHELQWEARHNAFTRHWDFETPEMAAPMWNHVEPFRFYVNHYSQIYFFFVFSQPQTVDIKSKSLYQPASLEGDVGLMLQLRVCSC